MNRNLHHLPFLDGIRGAAILSVFLYHCLSASFGFDQLGWNGLFRNFNVRPTFLAFYPLTYGWCGVSIFFLVSGFCIHLSYRKSSEQSWRGFYNRRFFRIYPAYLLAVIAFFFLRALKDGSFGGFEGLMQLGSHLALIHNFDSKTIYGINASFWSIAVEVQLYAIYPLLILGTQRWGWRNSLLTLFGIEFLIRLMGSIASIAYGHALPKYISESPLGYWFSWSIGAYIAQCFLDNRSSWLAKVRFDFMLVVAVALPFFRLTSPFAFTAFSVLTGIAIDRFVSERWKLPKSLLFGVAWKHLSFLGILSYSFYLFHQPFLALTGRLADKIMPGAQSNPLLLMVFCCCWYPVILIVSYFSFKWVEQPFIAIGKTAWRIINKSEEIEGGSPLQPPLPAATYLVRPEDAKKQD